MSSILCISILLVANNSFIQPSALVFETRRVNGKSTRRKNFNLRQKVLHKRRLILRSCPSFLHEFVSPSTTLPIEIPTQELQRVSVRATVSPLEARDVSRHRVLRKRIHRDHRTDIGGSLVSLTLNRRQR